MAKVAKLVLVSLMTRVVVEDTATHEEIVEAARPQLEAQMKSDLHENIEDVMDDEEMPYDPRYQCGSCEKEFEILDMGSCPHCGSGNWVEGCIDDNGLTIQDVHRVAKSINVTLSDDMAKEVLKNYPHEQEQDPSGTWDLVIEHCIRQLSKK